MNDSTHTSGGAARDFSNAVVVITGGGSGVGFACAQQFLDKAANVVLIGRDQTKLQSAADELAKNADAKQIQIIAGDVSNSAFADQAIGQASAHFDQAVTVMINNAGTIFRGSAEQTSDAQWQQVMDVNLNGVFYFSRAAALQMPDGGAIVNVSSTCGTVGAQGLAAYCASKGAVNMLTKTMALELAQRRINVNAVAPGAIDSPMLYSKHAQHVKDQQVTQNNLDSIPIGQLAHAQEIARAIVYLSQERHITGEVLNVDGGYTAR